MYLKKLAETVGAVPAFETTKPWKCTSKKLQAPAFIINSKQN